MIRLRLPSLSPHLFLSCALAALPLAAQELPLPGDVGRRLHVFDLHRLRPSGAVAPESPAERMAGPAARADTLDLAAVLRQHVEPPLGAGDDLTVLGGRWLTLLGSPQQIASLDGLLHHAERHRDVLVTTTVRLARLPAATFRDRVQQQLPPRAGTPAACEAVLTAATVRQLEQVLQETADAEVVAAPRVTTQPLQRASITMLEPISYVQDFTLERHGEQVIADPVVGVVEHGVRADLFAVPLADGTIAVHCDVLSQQVQQPIPSFETDLGIGTPVTIQLPRTTGVRFRQAAALAPGHVAVLASQQIDGDWLLALVEARLEPR